MGSSPVRVTNKKVSFVYQTKETFLRDAFLAERDAHCVRDAASPVMHAFGACAERIASLITRAAASLIIAAHLRGKNRFDKSHFYVILHHE
ncbi:MAG: hypothetical protein ACI3VY_02795, partial [Faecousia sp.]